MSKAMLLATLAEIKDAILDIDPCLSNRHERVVMIDFYIQMHQCFLKAEQSTKDLPNDD